MKFPVVICILCFFVFGSIYDNPSYGQIKSRGIPNTVHYSKGIYNAGSQNWSITQDKRGILYFGNNDGLLEFDGSYWNVNRLPNESIVRAVKSDTDGRIYVGAFNEFGYFEPDIHGILVYHSLVEKLDSNKRNFKEIWKVHFTPESVLFQSFTTIFEYKDNKINILIEQQDFHFSYYVGGHLFIKDNKRGLVKLVGKEIITLKGGDFFTNKNIWGIIPFNNDQFLICTAEDGLFIYDSTGIAEWQSDVTPFLVENKLFCATTIHDQYLVFGTVKNGVVISDFSGKPVLHLNTLKGLQNNTILSVFVDDADNLWLGLDNGIDYVNISSPVSFYVNKGEIGAGYCVALFDNTLFLGTNQGLYYKEWKSKEAPYSEWAVLKSLPNTGGQVWALKEIDGELFCGHDKGAFIIKKNKAIQISDQPGAWDFQKYTHNNTDYILSGTYTGFILYEKDKTNNWVFRNNIKGFDYSCRDFAIEENKVWISHNHYGLFRIQFDEPLTSVKHIDKFDYRNRLPEEGDISLLRLNNNLFFATSQGLMGYNTSSKKFLPHEELGKYFSHSAINKMFEQPGGDIWYFQSNTMGVLRLNYDGSYTSEILPFHTLNGNFIQAFEQMLQIDDENILICTEDGFVHFNPLIKNKQPGRFNVLIRSFECFPDSMLFGGNFIVNHEIGFDQPENNIPSIRFKNNSVKIRFSGQYYIKDEQLRYSYRLIPFEEQWSDRVNLTEKEYTNLKEGEYIFEVKAVNLIGTESETARYRFIILPPWYRTYWAYLLYALIIIALGFFITRFIRHKVEKEKRLLKEKQRKELQKREEAYNLEVSKAEQEIISLQKEKLEIENQRNKAELEVKNKELAAITMQIIHKNEVISEIKHKLSRVIQNMLHAESKKQVEKLINTLDKDLVREKDWEKFEINFDKVYEDFLKKLREAYTELTPKDLKLCAYLRMNLSSKEIAPLLNISVRGIEISRYRLRKKLQLGRDENLIEFLMKV